MRRDDGSVVRDRVEGSPVAVQGVQRSEEAENLQRRILDVHELWQLAHQERVEGIVPLGRVSLRPQLICSFPLALLGRTFAFLAAAGGRRLGGFAVVARAGLAAARGRSLSLADWSKRG